MKEFFQYRNNNEDLQWVRFNSNLFPISLNAFSKEWMLVIVNMYQTKWPQGVWTLSFCGYLSIVCLELFWE